MLVLVALGAIVIGNRHRILVFALASQEVPALLDPVDMGPEVRWVDDYFTVQELDERTFAIGEPLYWQQNYNYLILGTERAVLFDSGPGLRDIRPVAESLTNLEITFVPSHFHYDHVGNGTSFDRVAVVDLRYLRVRAPSDRLQFEFHEHLGVAEGIEPPLLEIDDWLTPGSTLSLGDRMLRVLYTPGHTEDSISLFNPESGYVFTGDFINPGPILAFLPNSDMGQYLQGTNTLIEEVPAGARLFSAHSVAPPELSVGAPELNMGDVRDLRDTLHAIRAGELESEGFYPVVYPVNDRIELLAEPQWLQNWASRDQVIVD
jgi:glyoxylase-like metal-dependent hydrolase (beta-lactamase superfamily II)